MPGTADTLPEAGEAAETLPSKASADAAAEDGSGSSGGGQPTETLEELQAKLTRLEKDNARRSAESQRNYQAWQAAEAEKNRLLGAQQAYMQQQQVAQQQQPQQPQRTEADMARELTEAQVAGDFGKAAAIFREIQNNATWAAQQSLAQQIQHASTVSARVSAISNFINKNPDLKDSSTRLFQETDAEYRAIMADPNYLGDKSQMQYDGRWISPGVLQAATERAQVRLGKTTQEIRDRIADETDTSIETSKPAGVRPGTSKGGAITEKHLDPTELEYCKKAKLTPAQYGKTLPPGNLEARLKQGRPVLPEGFHGRK